MSDIRDLNICKQEANGQWIPARPINYKYRSLPEKLRDAWAVFTGKAEAVVWPEQG